MIDFDHLDDSNTNINNVQKLSDFLPNLSSRNPGTHPWGVYPKKPVSQAAFESLSAEACIAAAEVPVHADLRPRIYNNNDHSWLLLDSGAAISCYPRRPGDPNTPDPDRALKAVNGARIATYGTKTVNLNFGGKTYAHDFIISDVTEAIVGWDMMLRYRLGVSWAADDCKLVDEKAKRTFPLKLRQVSNSQLNLSLVTFKQYSDKQKSLETEPCIIPPEYQKILDNYPEILKVNFHKIPKHNIIHTIDTGDSKPCKAKPRPVLPGTPKYIAGEKPWKELEELGIIQKVGAGEPTTWSSALHFATKSDGSLRPCGDYRGLNDRTRLDIYPLPSLRSFSAKLKGAKYFSKVDLLKSFHQIPLDPISANKTTLLTPYGT